jgi:hypothetical protein
LDVCENRRKGGANLRIKYAKEEILNLIKSKKVKPIGIRRDIDELGRLVIPKEYRDIMQTKSFEILLGETDGEKILILQKAKQR